jgi:hypothetical protein
MNRSGLFDAIFSGARKAMQWRLILLSLICSALPTLAVSAGVWSALQTVLSNNTQAAQLAERLDAPQVADVIAAFVRTGPAISGNALFAIFLGLLLAPWLSGVVLAAARTPASLRLGELIQVGLREYGRMLRLWCLALLLFGIALAVGAAVFDMADEKAGKALLEADANNLNFYAMLFAGFLLALVHLSVESARAQLVIDESLRSVLRAWWRGMRFNLRRPFSAFWIYILITAAGLFVAAVFSAWRLRTPALSVTSLFGGFILLQCALAAIAWARAARVFAYTQLATMATSRF